MTVIILPGRNRPGVTEVLSEILDERDLQDDKWGGPEHDDQHRLYDWNAFIADHNYKAVCACRSGQPLAWRQHMVEVAALALAGIESVNRGAKTSTEFDPNDPDSLEKMRRKFAEKLAEQDPTHPWITGNGAFAKYL